ncbi:MAG: trimeric intracellular cation channel family protein [Pseudomonadota bacterium]
MSALVLLDYLGVALFAATGALVASRKQMDIVGFAFLATLTGIGGGTVRDIMLDVPVFWIEAPIYLLVCVGAAGLVYIAAPMIEQRYRLLLWLDAAALSAFGVFGAFKGLDVTGSAVVAITMGMITGTVGGILRDVIAGEPSVLMRREIYITSALVAGVVYVGMRELGFASPVPALVGFSAAFGLRAGAIAFGWCLPQYKPRPGRDARKL